MAEDDSGLPQEKTCDIETWEIEYELNSFKDGKIILGLTFDAPDEDYYFIREEILNFSKEFKEFEKKRELNFLVNDLKRIIREIITPDKKSLMTKAVSEKIITKFDEICMHIRHIKYRNDKDATDESIREFIKSYKNLVQSYEDLAEEVGKSLSISKGSVKVVELEAKLKETRRSARAREARVAGEEAADRLSSTFTMRAMAEPKKIFWLIAAGVFLTLAIGLGIFLLYTQDETTLDSTLARISITSLLIYPAIFCASRYTRQRNIVDDYANKATFARTIKGFLNLFEHPEERQIFLHNVLSQIYQDPLRKKHEITTPLETSLRYLGKDQKP